MADLGRLLLVSRREETVVIEIGDKKFRVRIRSLSWGETLDCDEYAKGDLKIYRAMLVFKGLIDPKPPSLDEVLALPYGFIASVSRAVESLSMAGSTSQKKF